MKTSRSTKRNDNHKKIFPKYMQEKLAITTLVITLALFALVMVLYHLMTDKKEDYNQVVLSQQRYDSRVLPFKRGDIIDRNGTYLATSEKVYNLIIDPTQIMTDQDKYLEASVNALVECFDYDRTEILSLIQEKKDKPYVRYARQLTYDQKENFENYKKAKEEQFEKDKINAAINGIWFEDEYKRVYPYNSVGCNVIGFAGSDGMSGTGGIEQFYNEVLMGTNGRQYGYLNDESNLERVIKPAVNGNSIVSTMDANIQKVVERNINTWEEETGSLNAAVVVMDPNNGEILAMASDRQFDLNNPRELPEEYTDEVLRGLGLKEAVDDYKRKHKDGPEPKKITQEQVPQHYTEEEIMSLGKQVAWNQLWRNYCVSDTYEPGSPSKIFTVAAAMEEGVITGQESYECHGFLEVGDWKIKCVANLRGGHGILTVQESLMQSCNVVMMQIARQLGKERFYKYQQLFGFGAKTGVDLPGEADTKTVVYTADTTDPSSLATNSFGQNFNCTMIQMAAAYCSVINGGSYYEPHVVKRVINEQGSVVDKKEPRLVRETVSESTSRFINESLWRTVNDKPHGGTGSAAKIEGYDIAGKTGTAEKTPRDKKNYLVSFAGYAPADNPQVLVYVVIDQPDVEEQAHSTYASQMFQKIMAEILPYLNVFPAVDEPDEPSDVTGDLPQEEGIEKPSAPAESESGAEGQGGTPAGQDTPPDTTTEPEAGGQQPEAGEPPQQTAPLPEEEFIPPFEEGGMGLPAAVPGMAEESQPSPMAQPTEGTTGAGGPPAGAGASTGGGESPPVAGESQ